MDKVKPQQSAVASSPEHLAAAEKTTLELPDSAREAVASSPEQLAAVTETTPERSPSASEIASSTSQQLTQASSSEQPAAVAETTHELPASTGEAVASSLKQLAAVSETTPERSASAGEMTPPKPKSPEQRLPLGPVDSDEKSGKLNYFPEPLRIFFKRPELTIFLSVSSRNTARRFHFDAISHEPSGTFL